MSTLAEIAIDILQRTDDGDDLDPRDLKLLEMAVNGFLNEKGAIVFAQLHANVIAGYKKPWLCGVEHLTIDIAGFVRWKDSVVEHYSFDNLSAPEVVEQAKELGERCVILEAKGVTPTTRTAIWEWPD